MGAQIIVRGAREHNLKNINVEIPRNQLVVITGLSGSGKSSLAFDTLYAEGQRRYLESLSTYARQYLERFKKPDVDHISGLSPSIAIEQKSVAHNPRSTVATITEVYDFLRLLYSKVGTVFCPNCKRKVECQTLNQIAEQVEEIARGRSAAILAPIVRGRKGEYQKVLQSFAQKGFSHVRLDGNKCELHKPIKMHKNRRHDIDVYVDTVQVQTENRERMKRSLKVAMDLANGLVVVLVSYGSKQKLDEEHLFSEKMACPSCLTSFRDLAPNSFSFNSPYGACEKCRGIGKLSQVTSKQIVTNPEKPLLRGALNEEIFFSFNQYVIEDLVYKLREHFHFDLATPYQDLPENVKEALLWGAEDMTGLIGELEELFYSTSSQEVKRKVRKFIREDVCPSCLGARLKREALGVQIAGKNIVELAALPVEKALQFIRAIHYEGNEKKIATPILKEIEDRISFLADVGLSYITLDRPVNTLSGGELQRIRLAAQIGVGLTGVLYVLDEPSIGLHQQDNEKLLNSLTRLKELKNTVVVVEHDEETMRRADYIIDLGPGAGEHGGKIVGCGTAHELQALSQSLTGSYLSRARTVAFPGERKDYRKAKQLLIKGCAEHNLRNIDVSFPLGCLTVVTGVSGSGKSTLVHDILFRALHNYAWKTDYAVGKFRTINNLNLIDQVSEIDQKPIGRTPRSNPATYTDFFTAIRKLFSETREAKVRNFSPSRFSFNLKGGRCELCRGEGYQRLEMSFLPDVFVLCESCLGKRYNESTLGVRYRGKNIAEVLDLTAEDAMNFFDAIPMVRDRLALLCEIGLGYLRLGQSSTTLSGGEAQRMKLASELSKRETGKTLYILDEPTTGLHFADVENLLKALIRLRDSGNTVVVVEHNLDLIKVADFIIDLGPGGGEHGGEIMAAGSPDEICKVKKSITGQYLAKYLNRTTAN